LPDGPITPTHDGVRVVIRLSPRAKSDRLRGFAATAEGGRAIKVSVTAPAQDGRANEALLQLLSQTWRLRRGDLSLAAGAGSRSKIVRVAGDPHQLLAKLSREIADLPGG
jgi:uncharacterized protein (TIGR00251 family)